MGTRLPHATGPCAGHVSRTSHHPFLGAALIGFGPAGGCRNTILHGRLYRDFHPESPWPAPHSPRPSRMMAGWRCGGSFAKAPSPGAVFQQHQRQTPTCPPGSTGKVWSQENFQVAFSSGGRRIGVAIRLPRRFGRCREPSTARAREAGRPMCRLRLNTCVWSPIHCRPR